MTRSFRCRKQLLRVTALAQYEIWKRGEISVCAESHHGVLSARLTRVSRPLTFRLNAHVGKSIRTLRFAIFLASVLGTLAALLGSALYGRGATAYGATATD